jgi:FAD/FMN-containing dehydrogenase
VRALDVVTGGGRLLRATPTEHRDLFWALRGGKGTAGVVTAIEFDLVPLTHVYGGALHFDGADAARVLHLWRTWAPALPETATTSIAVRQLPPLPHVPAPLAGRMTVAVRLASTAPQDEAAALLDPLRAVASPVFGGTGLLPVTQLDVIHSDPPQPVPVQDRAVLLRELTAQTVDALLAVAGPGSGSPLAVVELRQLDGALQRAGAEPSAFRRDAAYSVQTIGLRTPETTDAVAAGAERVLAALVPWSTGATLPNLGHGGARAYDAATLDRLRAVVRARDEAGVLLEADTLR